jgi:hypothetical protein
MTALPVGQALLQFLFGLSGETAGDSGSSAIEGDKDAEPQSLAPGFTLPPLPPGAYADFLSRLKSQPAHASTKLLLRHIQRFNSLNVAVMDADGRDSAHAVFRRLVQLHASALARSPAWTSQPHEQEAGATRRLLLPEAVASLPTCLEKWAALRTYATVFAATPAARLKDERFFLKCAALRTFLAPSHLDLPHDVDSSPEVQAWELAAFHLTEIDRFRTPRDKSVCILNACGLLSGHMSALKAKQSAVRVLAEATGAAAAAGAASPVACDAPASDAAAHQQQQQHLSSAEDLLPALVLAVVRCNPRGFPSNVDYVRDYHAPDDLRGEAGYFLTHAESAVAFIESLEARHLTGITEEAFLAAMEAGGARARVDAIAAGLLKAGPDDAAPSSSQGSTAGVGVPAPTLPQPQPSLEEGPVTTQSLPDALAEEGGTGASQAAAVAQVIKTAISSFSTPAAAAPGDALQQDTPAAAAPGDALQQDGLPVESPPARTAAPPRAVTPEGAEGGSHGATGEADGHVSDQQSPLLQGASPSSQADVDDDPDAAALSDALSSLPSKVLVLSPEELVGVLVPPPPPGGDPAAAIHAWLTARLRFMHVSRAADLRLNDLGPLLEEYKHLGASAANLRYLLVQRDLLPVLSTLEPSVYKLDQ